MKSRTKAEKAPPRGIRAAPRRLSQPQRKALVKELMERFHAAEPNPRCELYYTTPFQLLLSVMLSAQTTDKAVNAAVREAYDQGLGPKEVLALGEVGFLKLIRRIGLAPTKAKRAVALAHLVLTRHDGAVPRDRDALEALPGVGRKTANVVLAELEQAPTLAVDTHVLRVTRRLGLHDATQPDKCEAQLLQLIEKKWLPRAHHWFILHGRYVCKAIKPRCDQCPMSDICPSVL